LAEFIAGLFCVVVGAFLLAAVGHGLWLAAAATVRWLSGNAAAPELRRRGPCPACGAPQGLEGGWCVYCRYQSNLAPAARHKSDLETAVRVLDRCAKEGHVDPQQHDALMAIVTREREQLGNALPEIGAAPTPSPISAPPPLAPEIDYLDQPVEAVVVSEPFAAAAPATEPKQIHPLDRDYSADAAAGPTLGGRARRRLADVLKAFMEESNIRWGEVVAGLLIVGSAIGCVISLQETLRKADPYVPASLFLLATAAIYGAGTYTLRRWNLKSVSRAILIIAILLIPLNFLTATTSPQRREITDPWYLAAVAIGLGVSGAICWSAARMLVRDAAPRLTLAVMAATASQLYISRLASADSDIIRATLLFALPGGALVVALVWQTARVLQWKALTPRRGEQAFIVAGIGTFAVSAAAGLLVYRMGNANVALERLSPSLAVVGASIVALGLALAERTKSANLATWRTSALAMALLGASLMTANLAFAWPEPMLLIVVGAISFITLASLGAAFRQPTLHFPAMACLTLAYVVGFHLLESEAYDRELGRRLLSLLWMGRTSAALTVLAIASVGAGAAMARLGRRDDGLRYLISGGALAAVSVLLALGVGFFRGPEADWATPILAFYSLVLLAVAVLRSMPAAAAGGSVLLLATLFHGLAIHPQIRAMLGEAELLPQRPYLAAALVHAVACATFAAALSAWRRFRGRVDVIPSWERLFDVFASGDLREGLLGDAADSRGDTAATFSLVAAAVSIAAAPFALYLSGEDTAPNAAYWFAISTVWLVISLLHRRPGFLAAFGWGSTIAVVLAAAAVAKRQEWWNGAWLHPRHLQIQIATLAIWALVWSIARRGAERSALWSRMLNSIRPGAADAALGIAVLGVLVLAAVACTPGILTELGIAKGVALSVGGASHTLLYDSGAWISLAAVLIALIVAIISKVNFERLLGLIVAIAAVPLLAAAPWEAEIATASAVRWHFVIYGVLTTAAICGRSQIGAATSRMTWLRAGELSSAARETLRSTSFLLTLVPILGLTITATVQFLSGAQLGGPARGSFFGAMSSSLLYAGPLMTLVAMLTAYALREKTVGYLVAGSVLFQITATLACLLSVAPLGVPLQTAASLLQWNAAALAVFSLVWLAVERWAWRRPARPGETSVIALDGQLAMMTLAVAALGGWSAFEILIRPANPSTAAAYLGTPPSYIALVLGALAAFWKLRVALPAAMVNVILGGAWVLGALAAASLADANTAGAWVSVYALIGSWLFVAVAATCIAAVGQSEAAPNAGWRGLVSSWSGAASVWASLVGLGVVVFAVRIASTDPLRPWWSATPVLVLAGCAAALAVARNVRGFSYAGAGLLALAATLVAIGPYIGLWTRKPHLAALELIEANLLAVIAAGGLSLAYSLLRGKVAFTRQIYFAPPLHATAAIGATAVFALLAFGGLVIASLGRAFGGSRELFIGEPMGLLTAVALGALLLGSLWHWAARYALPCLYAWGAVVIALGLDHLRLDLEKTVFAVVVAASSYVMLTGLLWRGGIGIAKVGARLGIPDPLEGLKRTATWLPGVNAIQVVPWTFLALWMVLGYEDRGMRFGAAVTPLLLAVGVGSLAQLRRQGTMQMASLLLVTIAVVFLGWADIDPSRSADVWLTRCVRMLIVLAAAAAVFGGVIVRVLGGDHSWRDAIRRITVLNGVASLATLALVLLLELSLFDRRTGVEGIEGAEIFAVAAVLAGLIAALISIALFPKHDPLSLPEEQRVWYIYAAEVVGVLLFAHIYMTMPELFTGRIRKYWAWIAVAIAWLGVGLGEWFRRSGVRVLGEPLGRTGVFLPLLPALAFWWQASLTSYAGVLFFVGLLYVLLSIQHKSFTYGVAAALAGNGALWAMMQGRDFTILEHPQFWLIPPALSVLTASHLTRRQLSEAQLAAIRYAAMLVIYLSSTGEMFITGIGESLWPVMVLLALSVAGIFAGIGLRVRAFLYLGAGFLLLSIISMVWHASKAFHHVWPWWAFGFALGVAILIFFALFEKRRDTMLQTIERLQSWEM
jgi:hypothetical protein